MSLGGSNVIGLFGGTFDPPHFGHIALANAASAALKLDELQIIPTGNPNFKRDATHSSALDRLEMCRLMLPFVTACPAYVNDTEIARGGITFTIDTVHEILNDAPSGLRLVFILGQDAFESLPRWKSADKLVSLVEFAVVPRAGGVVRMPSLPGLKAHVIDADPPAISSTKVRALIASSEDVSNYLPEAVYDYIKDHNLYTN
jgi:nicotinate-nucleotide adenylyltransferase